MRALHRAAVHSPEWHEKRKKGIGGSEWTSLMAIVDEEKYKYGCQRRIFYEKTGVEPDFPVLVSAAMERGSALEPVVHDMFLQNNPGVHPLAFHEWPPDTEFILPGEKRPKWWIGNPDGVYEEDEELGVEELKTMNQNVFMDSIENGISDAYTMQPLHYMALKGIHNGSIACLWPDGWGYFDQPAIWDTGTIRSMINAGELFWDTVRSGKDIGRPLPTELRCGKCPFRNKCLGKKYYATHVLKIKNMSSNDDLHALFEKFTELGEKESDSKRRKEDVKRQILRLMEGLGDPEHIICRGFELKASKRTSKKFDSNRVVSHHPEVVGDVTYEVPSRGFNLKRKKALVDAWDLKTL